MELEFLDVFDLRKQYFDSSRDVVVYGLGDYARQICMTLNACDMPVRFFCDDDNRIGGGRFHDLETIPPDKLTELHRPLVVLGDSRFHYLHARLAGLGVADVFGLRECLKYSYAEHLAERKELSPYFDKYNAEKTERILLEVYGNLGDIFVKAGIVRRMLDVYGRKNVFMLCDRLCGNGGEDFLRLFGENVIAVDRERFTADSDYRGDLLHRLNGCYFGMSICLCNVTYLSRRRCLNRLNLNVKQIHCRTDLHFQRYIPDLDATLARKFLPPGACGSLSPIGSVDQALSELHFSHALPTRFVSICMGASSLLRVYAAEKFARIVDHLAELGYQAVMLGYGEREERYFEKVSGLVCNPDWLISFISLLSIPEVLHVIQASAFFVGVESGPWNASYILGKSSVVLYGGGDYTGFRHRDAEIEYVTPGIWDCFECRWECNHVAANGAAACIDSIPPEQVITAVDKILIE
jgi:hypothetical protein